MITMQKTILLHLYGLMLVLCAGILGCAGTPDRFYTPKQISLPPEMVLNPVFKVHQVVDLVNAQHRKEPVLAGAYAHKWMVNLPVWTDVARQSLAAELQTRGYDVSLDAPTVFELILVEEPPGTVSGLLRIDVKKSGCPLDSDQDGVPDFLDRCPGTPRGVRVDALGCPLDSDQDGSPDYLDTCPGTPRPEGAADASIPPFPASAAVGASSPEKLPQGTRGALDPAPGSRGSDEARVQPYSIVSHERPDVVMYRLNTRFQEAGIPLTETQSNLFRFQTSTSTWQSLFGRIRTEFKDRNILVTPGPPQVFWLTLTDVSLSWGFREVRCRVNLHVRTTSDTVRNLEATGVEPELYASCDYALSKAVSRLFMEPPLFMDTDGDGVVDEEDACPDTPRGMKVDARGCPLDEDGDGVPDDLDQCPGTPRGVQVDEKGCPLDEDEDGVPDYMDLCPGTPKGTPVDERGCPHDAEVDTDGDGVPDGRDECPDTPRGVQVDERGCPLDEDGDGVPDYRDHCPGTPRGARVNHEGCWVISDALFEFDDAALDPRMLPLLDEVAIALRNNPSVILEIQGHTDNVGGRTYNQALSERRAASVKAYLEEKGIEGKRLIAVGYGSLRPKASNETPEGRAHNRRVELHPVQ